jgi:ABC-type multidrug transport system ATPase subunit
LTLDEELDALDPWDREHATSLLNWFLHRGGSLIVATHLAEVGVLGQEAVVLVDEEIAFAGSMDRLLSGADTVLEVETEDGGALKALIAPFQVKVEKLNPRQFRLTAQEGQELAVKMILEGYGTIRLVETRPPTLLEALTALESRLGRRQTR